MRQYLLDSGFLYASLDNSDRHHSSVKAVSETLDGTIILPVPAITETAYFLSRNLGTEAVARFVDSLNSLEFIIESPISTDFTRSAQILRKYHDSKVDFVDACIVAMAERLNITTILTVDRRDFGLFRPIHCNAFEILP